MSAHLEPMDPPEDPHPDLTLVTLAGAEIRNGWGHLIQLIPERVVAAQVVSRDAEGEPLSVRIL